jgi:hypothetical protein
MATSRSPDGDGAWRVEADIYAGRKNPTWSMDEDLAADLLRRWRELAAWSGAVPIAPPLGYRGFYLRNAPQEETWYVYRDYVRRTHAGMVEERLDAQRELERRLIASARKAGLPPLPPG